MAAKRYSQWVKHAPDPSSAPNKHHETIVCTKFTTHWHRMTGLLFDSLNPVDADNNWVVINSGNGLSPVRWIIVEWYSRNNFREICHFVRTSNDNGRGPMRVGPILLHAYMAYYSYNSRSWPQTTAEGSVRRIMRSPEIIVLSYL